jgi:hypothetical protein
MATAKKAKARPAAKSAAKKSAAKKPAARKAAPAKRTPARAASGGGRGEGYEDYSGKFTVRLPRSLHQALVDRAEKEGVSLNLFVTNALSRTVASAGKKGK